MGSSFGERALCPDDEDGQELPAPIVWVNDDSNLCPTALELGQRLVCGITSKTECPSCSRLIIEEAKPFRPAILTPPKDCRGLFTVISPVCQCCRNRVRCASRSGSRTIARVGAREPRGPGRLPFLRVDIGEEDLLIEREGEFFLLIASSMRSHA